MGASTSSPSRIPAWYPGEPSAYVLLGHDEYYVYGDAPSQPSLSKGGGDGSQRSVATEEGRRAGGAAPTTTATALPSPSPTSTAAAREPAAGGVGVSNPSSANRVAIDSKAKAKRVKRDISTLPVVELEDMKFIAEGAFCAVFACKYRGLSVVAKRVREDLPLPARREALSSLWDEFDCLGPLSHPNVIEAYGLCRVRCHEGYDDWNEKDVCLLLEELALGTIGHLFGTIHDTTEKSLASAMARSRKMKIIPFRCRLNRILELALALQYVHGGSGKGVLMHRDIKSVNVGFAKNGSLKLMDFGLSKMAPPGSTEDGTYKMTGEVGSYRYMAPELVLHQRYNAKVDIYSWAILSWEILAIDKPYGWATETTFVARVVTGGERPALHKSWPDRLCKLLASAWHIDHTKRPTAAQLVAELVAVKAELPAKYRRQHPVVTAPDPVGGVCGGSSSNRRHSWAPQESSPLLDIDDRTRHLSAAATTTRQPQPAKSVPLPVTSSSTSVDSEKPQRRSVASGKRSSCLGEAAPSAAEVGRGADTPRREPVAGIRITRRTRSTSAGSAADSVDEENDNENQHHRRRGSGRTREPGDDDGRQQPLNRRRSSWLRATIVDALAREATTGAEALRAGQQRASSGQGGQTNGGQRRRRSSRQRRRPPRDDSDVSARARRMPARDSNHNEKNETTDVRIGKHGEGTGMAGGGIRGKHEAEIGRLLPSGRAILLGTAVAEEESDEGHDEDASGGRNRGFHRNRSLDKLWPALPTGWDAKDVPQQAPTRTGAVRGAAEPKGKAAPPVRAGGVTSEKEVTIFAMLGTPSGMESAEVIEERLTLLRGTLSMPRTIS